MDLTLRGGEFVAVALLAEGGDRNIRASFDTGKATVALLAEGGDRNSIICGKASARSPSPSSRRAGIEIRRP